ncbi:MAG: Uma2 family endonuclease [Dehalococcoidia bacterium]
MPVSEATYEQVALEDPEGQWELVCGRLRSKPGMTTEHNAAQRALGRILDRQLDERQSVVAQNSARLRISTGTYYVPDLCVIPIAAERRLRETRPRRLEVYETPMPLVVEVWSPSTGEYDVDNKLPEYQWRGDREIWRIHPYERTLTAWRRQPDGTYVETLYREATIEPVALPGVRIAIEPLFE